MEDSSMYYFDLSMGKKLILSDIFSLTPSIGIRGGESQSDGSHYIGYGLTIPLMYQNKKFNIGSFIKYQYISKFDNNQIVLRNQNSYILGGKILLNSSIKWFLKYEYLLNSKYKTHNATDVYFGHSQVGIGIQNHF